MYYFLGIVSSDDVLSGVWKPSYVLRKTKKAADTRSGYFVTREDSGTFTNMPKV